MELYEHFMEQSALCASLGVCVCVEQNERQIEILVSGCRLIKEAHEIYRNCTLSLALFGRIRIWMLRLFRFCSKPCSSAPLLSSNLPYSDFVEAMEMRNFMCGPNKTMPSILDVIHFNIP